MIVDTSAMVAILAREPEREVFVESILQDRSPCMSAAGYLETAVVIDRYRDPVLSRRLDELIAELGIDLVDVTAGQARLAREAYRDFGRGSGHPAGLNFGDCFAYALAKSEQQTLLFNGQDFTHTDLRPAI
ncbi:MAG: type II toxin-antitoxin system VapC family toxin [Nocardioidaceae bacterium]